MSLLIIGLDGATFDLLRPWCKAGHLPNLARLMAEGVTGPLESTLPPVTAAAWASFMTGKQPAGHGVFDFFRGHGGDIRLVQAGDVDGRTLWQLLSEAGFRVGVLNVPNTHPPEPVNGFLVPGLLSPDQGQTTYPPGLLAPHRAELGPYRLTPNLAYKDGNEAAYIVELQAVLDTQVRYALRLAREQPVDFLMVHFLVTDIAQHALWQHLDPSHPRHRPQRAARYASAVRDLFSRVDTAVGQLLERMPAGTTTIVMSDHGFGPLHEIVNLNLLLIDRGLMALKRNAGVRLRNWAARGLHPGIGRRLARFLGREKLLGFDDVDWSHTLAYSLGHLGQIYINLKDREPHGTVEPGDYEAVRARVSQVLRSVRNPTTGQSLVSQILPGEAGGDGPHASLGPDLHVILDDYRAVAHPLFATDGRAIFRPKDGNSGDHRRQGVLIAAGPGFQRGQAIEGAHIVDLAPTILHLMGVPVPEEMDGRVLVEALSGAGAVSAAQSRAGTGRPRAMAEQSLTPREEDIVRAQLRNLGYLG